MCERENEKERKKERKRERERERKRKSTKFHACSSRTIVTCVSTH